MRPFLCALVSSTLALPAAALAQDYTNEASEGTYSQYPADEARGGAVVQEVGQEIGAVNEQQLFDAFWNELGPYGRWDEHETYGWVWYPSTIVDFRPYVNGEWVYTTDGWMFTSDDPFAWAVYHYGTWEYLEGGWAWIPGYEWAPAWVSFRSDGDYVGWAPLGPGGLEYGWNQWPRYGFSPWTFVPVDHFGWGPVATSVVPAGTAQGAFHRAQPVGGVTHGRCHGIPGTHHAAAVPITAAATAAGNSGTSHGATPLSIYRPQPHSNQSPSANHGFAYHPGARGPSMHPGGRPGGSEPSGSRPPSAPHGVGQSGAAPMHPQGAQGSHGAVQGGGPQPAHGAPQGGGAAAVHPSNSGNSGSSGKDSRH